MNILILSCGTRCLLVDYFMDRMNGFEKVVVTDCSSYSPALYRADKYYIVPRISDDNYIPIIIKICYDESITTVLPLQEEDLLLIAKHREDFTSINITPIVSSFDSIKLCKDKFSFYLKMQNDGIPIVPTFLLDNEVDILTQYGIPIYMKPRYGAGSVSNYVIHNSDAIKYIIENETQEFVLQPYINGTEYGVNAYVDLISKELVEVFILKKIKMRAGETEKSVSLHNEVILTIVKKICDSVSLCGPVDIDIMENNGNFYVLEVNPRFGGAYPHTHSCGMNFVRMIANNVIGLKNELFKMEYEDDIVAFRYMNVSTMKIKDTDDA